MSPFYSPTAPADESSFGNFVTLNYVARFTLNTYTDKDIVLVFCPGNQNVYQCIAFNDLGQALRPFNESPARKFLTEPPTMSRTLRGSLRFRNITSNQMLVDLLMY